MRKLAFVLSGYISGIALSATEVNITAIIASLLLAIFLRVVFGRNKGFFVGMAVIMAFCIGASQFAAVKENKDDFLKWAENKYVTIYGKVDSVPEKSGNFYSSTLRIQTIKYADKTYECNEKIKLYSKDNPEYVFGDIIRVVGAIQKPEKAKFDGALDSEIFLRSDGITGTVFAGKTFITRMYSDITLYDRMRALRYTIADIIDSYATGEGKELLKGIATGDTSGFSDEMSYAFIDSGISHITAVSGMNVTMLVAFVMFLFSFTGLPRKIRTAVSIIAVMIYVVITGLSPSVVRASVMIILALTASLFDRQEDVITSTVLAASVILCANPYSIFDAGFQLSFSSVIGIRLLAPYVNSLFRKFLPDFMADVAGVTLCAQIATLPVVVYIFNRISLVSMLTNIVVVPVIEILFIGTFGMILAGIIFPQLAVVIAAVLNLLADAVIIVAKGFASFSFATVTVKTPDLILIFTYLFVLCIIYLSLKNKRFYKLPSAAAGILIALSIVFNCIPSGTFEITFVNVGQGDCIYISCPTGENFLVDTGTNEYDAVSFLRHNGITHLDKVFVTHIDADHSGGLESVLAGANVDEVVLPKIAHTETVLFGKSIADTNVRYVDYTDEFIFDDCKIDVLWPGIALLEDDIKNNNSIVLNINYKDNNFLLMSDVEMPAEEMIINENVLDADVIKVGHHGSDKSTSDKLLEWAVPEYAVISVGENSYGHPTEDVLLRLEEHGCNVFRTNINGNVTFVVDKDGTMKIK